MKLSTWLVKNLNLIDCNVEEVREKGIFYGIRFLGTSDNRPGYHTHDNLPSHPTAIKHATQEMQHSVPTGISSVPKKKNMPHDYFEDCDVDRCEVGKYKNNEGYYGICYRCEGKGYITRAKHIKNLQYDNRMVHRPNESLDSLL